MQLRAVRLRRCHRSHGSHSFRFGAIDRELSQQPARPSASPAVAFAAQLPAQHLWGQQVVVGSNPDDDQFFVA